MSGSRIAERIGAVAPSGILSVAEKVMEMKRAGIDVLSLSAGRPDFDTPTYIKEAAKRALDEGYTSYTQSSGLPELREAIADKLAKENGIEFDPRSEIVVTVGAKEAVFAAILVNINRGDEVLITDPIYPGYVPCVRFAEGIPVALPVKEENDFRISCEDVESALTPRTKMLIINSPNNPTGAVFTKADLEAIADLARARDLLVLSDEIYEKIIYDAEHYSIASFPGMKDRTITVNGFSKTYAMTGWRIGYLATGKELVRRIMLMHSNSVTCACSFAQKAATVALKGPQREVEEMVREYRRRRDLIINELAKMSDITCKTPKGSFYAFPNISQLGKSSQEIAQFLLDSARVATVPGSAFGKEGEGHLRLSFASAYEDIKQALERMKVALEDL